MKPEIKKYLHFEEVKPWSALDKIKDRWARIDKSHKKKIPNYLAVLVVFSWSVYCWATINETHFICIRHEHSNLEEAVSFFKWVTLIASGLASIFFIMGKVLDAFKDE